jgi:maltose O-acetyltransferase
MITEKQKMLAGEYYIASDPELQADVQRAAQWMDRFNAAHSRTPKQTDTLLREGLGQVGQDCIVRPPFYCDYGYNIALGTAVFINFNCCILDVAPVTIGDQTLIGPGVQILTADHPRNPEQRRQMLEYGRPVHISRNVWIGAGAIILPGVTIGNDAIIGAGSVVTRDVPARATAMGNPARVKTTVPTGDRL